MPYTTCFYIFIFIVIIVYFIKPVYISRVSQLHATQTQGPRPHVPQILIPPREMKAWAVIGFIIRVERWESSAGLEKEIVCPAWLKGAFGASKSIAWSSQLKGEMSSQTGLLSKDGLCSPQSDCQWNSTWALDMYRLISRTPTINKQN